MNTTKPAATEAKSSVSITTEKMNGLKADGILKAMGASLANADSVFLNDRIRGIVSNNIGSIVVGPSESFTSEDVYFKDAKSGTIVRAEEGSVLQASNSIFVAKSAVDASKRGQPLVMFEEFGLNLKACSGEMDHHVAYTKPESGVAIRRDETKE
ncbi:MAG: hypothetical protein KGH94_00140 [Candidatus Micrarchaeota archaeon]|nr:hypothetical protein [Candidatus Micrarchaeota archaeon]